MRSSLASFAAPGVRHAALSDDPADVVAVVPRDLGDLLDGVSGSDGVGDGVVDRLDPRRRPR